MNSFFRSGSPAGNLEAIFPFLKKIAPGWCGHKKRMEAKNDLMNFFRVGLQFMTLILEGSIIR
jgi:hypothetical protein